MSSSRKVARTDTGAKTSMLLHMAAGDGKKRGSMTDNEDGSGSNNNRDLEEASSPWKEAFMRSEIFRELKLKIAKDGNWDTISDVTRLALIKSWLEVSSQQVEKALALMNAQSTQPDHPDHQDQWEAFIRENGFDSGVVGKLKEAARAGMWGIYPKKIIFFAIEQILKCTSEHSEKILNVLKSDSKNDSLTSELSRMVPQDFGWDVPLSHNIDVDDLANEILKVHDWHTRTNIRSKFLAPLLNVIQSSGTGKSRLLHDAKSRLPRHILCRSILLFPEGADAKEMSDITKGSYNRCHVIPTPLSVTDQEPDTQHPRLLQMKTSLRWMIFDECQKALESSSERDTTKQTADGNISQIDIVLFIDEAQYLAQDYGYLYRVLRWITREKPEERTDAREQRFRITAVMAGTTSKLANFFPEIETTSSTTRYLQEDSDCHYDEGKTPFPPFFMLRTMGCLAIKSDPKNEADVQRNTQYERAIPYGRPLFEMMYRRGKLCLEGNLFVIAHKMVLGKTVWKNHLISCLSILGTRIQMGRTSVQVVSELVSKGYAHLTSFEYSTLAGMPHRATCAFLPDPVCARVAMCLCDEEFKLKKDRSQNTSKGSLTLCGMSKLDLAGKLRDLFTSGLCTANKGDIGEVACALYLLFCADVIRKPVKKDAKYSEYYTTFSVDLCDWLEVLAAGGSTVTIKDESKASSTTNNSKEERKINCIQFFRLPLRLSLDQMTNHKFLESLYQKACGIYCDTNAPAVDMIVPCKVVDKHKQVSYIAVFISVKNYDYLSPSVANKFTLTSIARLQNTTQNEERVNSKDSPDATGKQHGIQSNRGLFLQCILGQSRKEVRNSDYLSLLGRGGGTQEASVLDMPADAKDPVSDLSQPPWNIGNITTKIVPMTLCVHNDVFGIHDAVVGIKSNKNIQQAELFEAHSELIWKAEEDYYDVSVVRGKPHQSSTEMFYRTQGAAALTGGREQQP